MSNWNKARADRVLAEDYLARLSDDLCQDIHSFDTLTKYSTIKKEIILALRDEDVSDIMTRIGDDFILFLNYAAWIALPAVRSATFDVLLGAGNYTLIQNVGLRGALYRYYAAYTLLSRINAESISDYRKLLYEQVPGEELIRQRITLEDGWISSPAIKGRSIDQGGTVETLSFVYRTLKYADVEVGVEVERSSFVAR